MSLLERFLKYVKINTMSAEGKDLTPSTPEQFNLAKVLEAELTELGLLDIKLNDNLVHFQCVRMKNMKVKRLLI